MNRGQPNFTVLMERASCSRLEAVWKDGFRIRLLHQQYDDILWQLNTCFLLKVFNTFVGVIK